MPCPWAECRRLISMSSSPVPTSALVRFCRRYCLIATTMPRSVRTVAMIPNTIVAVRGSEASDAPERAAAGAGSALAHGSD